MALDPSHRSCRAATSGPTEMKVSFLTARAFPVHGLRWNELLGGRDRRTNGSPALLRGGVAPSFLRNSSVSDPKFKFLALMKY